MHKRPEGCILPDCLHCPLDDCQYSRIEPVDARATKRLNVWVHYQKACLDGQTEKMRYENRHPEVIENTYR